MIEIFIPDDNIPERTYALHVLLSEYLGVEYSLHISGDQSDYAIRFNEHVLRINDSFFGKYAARASYLHVDHLPVASFKCTSDGLDGVQLIFGEDVLTRQVVEADKTRTSPPQNLVDIDLSDIAIEPGVLGDDADVDAGSLTVNGDDQRDKADKWNDSHAIYCGVDLIASTFFMLTRWEEYVIQNRDAHGRFPAASSLACKSGFIRRPVVNEYAALLKKLLIELGVGEGSFKQREYCLTLTVDVDFPRHWKPGPNALKKLLGTALRTKSIRATREKLDSYKEFQKSGHDTYDTFDFLMDCAEANDTKAYFFFMTGGSHREDPGNTLDEAETLDIARKITDRGHHTGLHPSYDAAVDEVIFNLEAEIFTTLMGAPPAYGRQHYLRFEVPYTWRLWDKSNARWESSMSYSDEIGFRCGTCAAFPVFDIIRRRMLSLFEKPLIVMDVAMRHNMRLTLDEAIIACQEVKAEVEKHGGEFVVLWHNSSFGDEEWRGWDKVLEVICGI